MKNKIKLKPCPFCGSKAQIGSFDWERGTSWFVECSVENLCNVQPKAQASSKQQAIAAWNRRTPNV
jgi:Lar family restriction alleviation protein